jgi:hypothetical protein
MTHVAHLMNIGLDCNTGYVKFVKDLIAPELLAQGLDSTFINVTQSFLDRAGVDFPKDILFEEVAGSRDCWGVTSELINRVKGASAVVIHSPVVLPLDFFRYLTSISRDSVNPVKIYVVLHDISPLIPHNGFWRGITWSMPDTCRKLARKPLEVLTKTGTADFLATVCNIDVSKVSLSHYQRYLAAFLDFIRWGTATVIAPSEMIYQCYLPFNVLPLVRHHPMKARNLSPQPRRSDVVMSVFAWEKFDYVTYLMLVRSMWLKGMKFELHADERMRTAYLDPYFKGYGKPDNLTVLPMVEQEVFLKRVAENPPSVFLHMSSVAESYAMVVDEMMHLGIPVLHYGNSSAIEERLPTYLDEHDVEVESFVSARLEFVVLQTHLTRMFEIKNVPPYTPTAVRQYVTEVFGDVLNK